nr:response regulator [Gemmatimonadaceae bacterium]
TVGSALNSHALLESEGIRALAMIPLTRLGECLGVVVIGSRSAAKFSAGDVERIESMADLLSVALTNAELVDSLRQAEWRFRTLFRAAPDAVLTVLHSGRIRDANDAVRDVIGLEPSHVVGRVLEDLIVPEDQPRLAEVLEQAFAGTPGRLEVALAQVAAGEGIGLERVAGRAHRARRTVSFAASRLPQADPPSVLLVGRDMTADREMRARLMESDRLAAVGELVAGVAHEVNNPLSSISAFAQLLLRDASLTDAQRESIDVIRSETHRASQVVKDLLTFARRSDPFREPLDINGVVERSLRLRQYQLTANGVEVHADLGNDIPAVIGDARQLQQVCLNLLTNAIQAIAASGTGEVRIATRLDGRHVLLEVSDTGPGIPSDVRARIFEPFFTTKGEGEGTGLGLSVSFGIVSAHGGAITVAETSSSGTTFRVALPAADAPAIEASAAREGASFRRRSPLAGIRLLFVDDEPTLRASMDAFAELRGFTVITAADGHTALETVMKTAVDAVVCDLRMPGIDGLEFHERLRVVRPGLAARTIFVTGDVVTTTLRGEIRQPIVTKPFGFEQLEDVLVAVLRGTPMPSAEHGATSSAPARAPDRVG